METFLVAMENLITVSVIVLLSVFVARVSMSMEDQKNKSDDGEEWF